MTFTEEVLPGTWVIRLNRLQDARGSFVKTYGRSVHEAAGFGYLDLREEFYSTSHRGVLRGMHFQVPPHEHVKLVYCAVGAVDDVMLDLRSGDGYGRVAAVRLEGTHPVALLIPAGVAHGFRSLADHSLMIYKTTSEHSPAHDRGIRWDSFGHDWGDDSPTMSERDRLHPALADFVSPF